MVWSAKFRGGGGALTLPGPPSSYTSEYMSSWTKEFLSVDNCIWCLIELSFPWLAHEAHCSIHRSKNGLPFFLSSIPSSFRTQEKLGEPLEAWEHIAGNTYYCCMGCFTVVVVSTLSCAILNGVSFLESLRLYELLKLFHTDVLVPELRWYY